MKTILFAFALQMLLTTTIFASDRMQQEIINLFAANRSPLQLAESAAHRRVAQTVDLYTTLIRQRQSASTKPATTTTTSTCATVTDTNLSVTASLTMARRIPSLERSLRNTEYLNRFKPAVQVTNSENIDATLSRVNQRLGQFPALKHELTNDFTRRLVETGHFMGFPCIKTFEPNDTILMAATVCNHSKNGNPSEVAVFLAKDNTVYCRSLNSQASSFPPINLQSQVIALDACGARMAFATDHEITVCDINDIQADDITILNKLTNTDNQFIGFAFEDEDTIIAITNDSKVLKYKLLTKNHFSQVAHCTIDPNFILSKIICNQATKRCFVMGNDPMTQTGAIFTFNYALNLTDATLLNTNKLTDIACTNTGQLLSIAYHAPGDFSRTNIQQYVISDTGKCVQTLNWIGMPVNGELYAKLCYLQPTPEYPERHILFCTANTRQALLKSASHKFGSDGRIQLVNINSNHLTQTNIGTIPGTSLFFGNNEILSYEFPLEAACLQGALNNVDSCIDLQRIEESPVFAQLSQPYKNYFEQAIEQVSKNYGPIGFVRKHPYIALFALQTLLNLIDIRTESILPDTIFNVSPISLIRCLNTLSFAIVMWGRGISPRQIITSDIIISILTGNYNNIIGLLNLCAANHLHNSHLVTSGGMFLLSFANLSSSIAKAFINYTLDHPENFSKTLLYKVFEPLSFIRQIPADGKLVTSILGAHWLMSFILKV